MWADTNVSSSTMYFSTASNATAGTTLPSQCFGTAQRYRPAYVPSFDVEELRAAIASHREQRAATVRFIARHQPRARARDRAPRPQARQHRPSWATAIRAHAAR